MNDVRQLRDRLHGDLVVAMKSRETAVVAALRTAIAAIDNAEAADIADVADGDGARPATSEHFAGARAGLRSTEVARRALSIEDLRRILLGQIDERIGQAAEFEAAGRADAAECLRAEAAALKKYVPEDR